MNENNTKLNVTKRIMTKSKNNNKLTEIHTDFFYKNVSLLNIFPNKYQGKKNDPH